MSTQRTTPTSTALTQSTASSSQTFIKISYYLAEDKLRIIPQSASISPGHVA
jgi:hypothetical protein